MNEIMTTGEVMALMGSFGDRLSGKILVDGVLYMDTVAQAATERVVREWDEWGYSSGNDLDCVQIKEVERHKTEWLVSGDEFKIQAAQEQSQFYGIMIPGREYSDENKERLRKNIASFSQRTGMQGLQVTTFRHYGEMFINIDTGETQDTLSDLERLSNRWVWNKDYMGDAIPNHSTVAWGNLTNPEHPSWASRFVPGVIEEVFSLMRRRANSLKQAARRTAEGAIPPTPGSVEGRTVG